MGGSKTTTRENSKTTQEIPQEIRDRGTTLTNAAMANYFNPADPTKNFSTQNPNFNNYMAIGQNTTGAMNDYNGANGQAAQQFSAAGSSYQPYIDSATSTAEAAGADPNNKAQTGSVPNYSMDALQRYMNPYAQNVIDQGVTQIGQDLNAQMQQNGSAAAMAGAFGGARHGIIDSQSQKNAATTLSNFIGTQLAQNFNNAQGQFNTGVGQQQQQQSLNNAAAAQNFNQQTSLSQIMANLGKQKQDQQIASGNADLAFGNNLTANDQATKTNAYNYGYMGPMDVYNNLAAMNAMQPINRTSTTNGTSTSSTSGGWLGPALGAVGGLLSDKRAKTNIRDVDPEEVLGAFAMLSDERAKEHVEEVDPEQVLGAFAEVKPKSYDYKPEVIEAHPDLARPGRRTGFMAQDLERAFGQPSGPEIDGLKSVDLAQVMGNVVAAIHGLEKRTRPLALKPKKKAA